MKRFNVFQYAIVKMSQVFKWAKKIKRQIGPNIKKNKFVVVLNHNTWVLIDKNTVISSWSTNYQFWLKLIFILYLLYPSDPDLKYINDWRFLNNSFYVIGLNRKWKYRWIDILAKPEYQYGSNHLVFGWL